MNMLKAPLTVCGRSFLYQQKKFQRASAELGNLAELRFI